MQGIVSLFLSFVCFAILSYLSIYLLFICYFSLMCQSLKSSQIQEEEWIIWFNGLHLVSIKTSTIPNAGYGCFAGQITNLVSALASIMEMLSIQLLSLCTK